MSWKNDHVSFTLVCLLQVIYSYLNVLPHFSSPELQLSNFASRLVSCLIVSLNWIKCNKGGSSRFLHYMLWCQVNNLPASCAAESKSWPSFHDHFGDFGMSPYSFRLFCAVSVNFVKISITCGYNDRQVPFLTLRPLITPRNGTSARIRRLRILNVHEGDDFQILFRLLHALRDAAFCC